MHFPLKVLIFIKVITYMKNAISISLSEDLLEKIDFERQLAPRSTYIEFLLRKLLKEKDKNEL